MVISPDSKKLLSGSDDRKSKLWDVDADGTLKAGLILRGHTGWAFGAAVSQDGKYVASGSADSTIRVWDGEAFLS